MSGDSIMIFVYGMVTGGWLTLMVFVCHDWIREHKV